MAGDPLQAVVDDVKRRQLDAIRAELPGAFDGHAERLSATTATGLGILAELAGRDPESGALVAELTAVAAGDSRFAFLAAVPDAPLLSMARALALERTLFGSTSDAVAEIALLMGLFTVLLDGLLDEAPEELVGARAWFDEVMRGRAWGAGGPRALPPAPPAASHPVTKLAIRVTCEIIAAVTSQPGWSDATGRGEFLRASGAAYAAEIRSEELRIWPASTPPEAMRARVIEKSTTCIWAGALIPLCVHPWPAALSPDQFRDFAFAVGAYGGWVDDVVDLLVDLRANRWSAALLELHALAGQWDGEVTAHDPRSVIARALLIPILAGRLPAGGVARLQAVRESLPSLGFDTEPLMPALADLTAACLTEGPAVRAA